MVSGGGEGRGGEGRIIRPNKARTEKRRELGTKASKCFPFKLCE